VRELESLTAVLKMILGLGAPDVVLEGGGVQVPDGDGRADEGVVALVERDQGVSYPKLTPPVHGTCVLVEGDGSPASLVLVQLAEKTVREARRAPLSVCKEEKFWPMSEVSKGKEGRATISAPR
jgi:hypothetical protein